MPLIYKTFSPEKNRHFVILIRTLTRLHFEIAYFSQIKR